MSVALEAKLKNPLLEDGYLTEAQAAQFLGVCQRTLYRRYLERSGPPRITVGRKIFYKRTSLLAWLDVNERQQINSERRPRRAASASATNGVR